MKATIMTLLALASSHKEFNMSL